MYFQFPVLRVPEVCHTYNYYSPYEVLLPVGCLLYDVQGTIPGAFCTRVLTDTGVPGTSISTVVTRKFNISRSRCRTKLRLTNRCQLIRYIYGRKHTDRRHILRVPQTFQSADAEKEAPFVSNSLSTCSCSSCTRSTDFTTGIHPSKIPAFRP